MDGWHARGSSTPCLPGYEVAAVSDRLVIRRRVCPWYKLASWTAIFLTLGLFFHTLQTALFEQDLTGLGLPVCIPCPFLGVLFALLLAFFFCTPEETTLLMEKDGMLFFNCRRVFRRDLTLRIFLESVIEFKLYSLGNDKFRIKVLFDDFGVLKEVTLLDRCPLQPLRDLLAVFKKMQKSFKMSDMLGKRIIRGATVSNALEILGR